MFFLRVKIMLVYLSNEVNYISRSGVRFCAGEVTFDKASLCVHPSRLYGAATPIRSIEPAVRLRPCFGSLINRHGF